MTEKIRLCTDPSRRDAMKGLAALAALPLLPQPGHGVLARADAPGPREVSFDGGWRFLRGDATGAERPEIDDAGWRTLDVPHDWSIEDLPPTPEPDGEAAVWAAGPRY